MEKRRAIVRNMTNVYKRRSRFVHHGKHVPYDETLDEFCFNLLSFFTKLALSLEQYETTADFFESIERIKFS